MAALPSVSSTAASSTIAATATAASSSLVTGTIVLTDEEKKLFGLILEATTALKLDVVIRVAGGWVRDKLLGRESYDIDFALSNMTGEDFATRINTYLQAQGHQVHGIGVIKRNPDQSKQLETATFKLNGISIDVNNLRSETYTDDDGRIPVMAMGTAQQDSERRDFTINAMYYNIHTGLVEDLVNGLPDLRAGIVRTPLPPMTTFSDDPLRILRAARFAGRFGYTVHADIEKAAMDPSIQDKLLRKVSRERYGQEVGKMLLSLPERATSGIRFLAKWGLVPIVFALPIDASMIAPDQPLVAKMGGHVFPLLGIASSGASETKSVKDRVSDVSMRVMETMTTLIATSSLPRIAPVIAEEKKLLLLSSFLSPYYGWKYRSKKPCPIGSFIVMESLKLPTRDADLSFLLLDTAHSLLQCASRVPWLSSTAVTEAALADLRIQLGHTLVAVKDQWPAAFEVALALHTSLHSVSSSSYAATVAAAATEWKTVSSRPPLFGSSSSSSSASSSSIWTLTDSSPAIVHLLHWLVRDSNLLFHTTGGATAVSSSSSFPAGGAWDWKSKPYFAGKELGSVCNINPGPAMGEIMAKQLEWRFTHPSGTMPECEAWLRANHRAAGDAPPEAAPKKEKAKAAASAAPKGKQEPKKAGSGGKKKGSKK